MGLIKISKKQCKNCKKIKELRWRPNQKFCSIECFGEWEKGKNNPAYTERIKLICFNCKKEFWDRPYRLRAKQPCCSIKCARTLMGKNRLAENHPNWKNGRTKTLRGYVYILRPNHPFANKSGHVMEHRLVMELNLVRFLNPSEVVHHLNHILDDNRIENLMLFKNEQEHMKFHQPKGKQIGSNRKGE